jgi:glycolate oxidase iron-sulfur subunit
MEDTNEGMSARGRIVLLRKFSDGEVAPSEILDKRIFSCILCGACNTLCPLGINITDSIYKGRKSLRGFSRKRRLFSFGVRFALKRHYRGLRLLKALESISRIFPISRVQPFKAIKKIGISFPDSSLRDSVSIFKAHKAHRPKGRIAVFAGCSANFLYPNIGRSLIYSLNNINYDVVLPKGEVCCGAPLLGLGLEEDAAELAERNMETFKKLNVEAVVGLCPTCVHFIRTKYRMLVGDRIDNALEASQFLSSELGVRSSELINSKLRVVYHDPCHSVYNLNVSKEPRQILKSMGFNLIDSDRGCCGFGGTFRLLYQELSEALLNRRVEEYKKADMIVTSCPNCILQLKSKIKDKQVKHVIELIKESLHGDRNERHGR